MFVLGCDSSGSGGENDNFTNDSESSSSSSSVTDTDITRCSSLKKTLTSDVVKDGSITEDYLDFAKGCGVDIFVFEGSSNLARRLTNWRVVTEDGFPIVEPNNWVVFVEQLVVIATEPADESAHFEIQAEDKFLCETHSFAFTRDSLKKDGQKNSLEGGVHTVLDVKEYYLSFCQYGPTVKIHVENDAGIQVDDSLYYNTYFEEKDNFSSRSDTLLFLSPSTVHDGFALAIPTSRLAGDKSYSFGFYPAGSSTFVNGECRHIDINGSIGPLTPESAPTTLKWELGGVREVEDKFCVGVRPDNVRDVDGVVMYN